MSRIIVKNIPSHTKQSQLTAHFSKVGEVTDCKIIRNQNGISRRFCFIGFNKTQSAYQAIKQYNDTFIGVSKISISEAKLKQQDSNYMVKKNSNQKIQSNKTIQSKFNDFKQIIQQSSKKSWDDMLTPTNYQIQQLPSKKSMKKQKIKMKEQVLKPNKKQAIKQTQIIKTPILSQKNKNYLKKPLGVDESRIYVTNIPYNLTEQELKNSFQKFGRITKIKLPMSNDKKNKGYAFINFEMSEQALRAFSQVDNTVMFGRILHVKPSLEDIGEIIKNGKEQQYQRLNKQKYGDSLEEKTSYKKKKKREMRNRLNDISSWNTLFLNPNSILERMSEKLGITKSQILLSDNLATKIALVEAQVVQETKDWMKSVGINLDFLKTDRSLCQRSKTIVLIKNLNYRTMESELKELLNFYGVVNRLLLASNRAIGLVQYENEQYASNAMQKLQNHKFKNNFLYLEYAPIGMIKESQLQKQVQRQEQAKTQMQERSKIIYIKNLSFDTDESMIYSLFESNKIKSNQIKSLKIIKTKEGKSMGYGFVQLQSTQLAEKIIKQFQNKILDGHKLGISISKKSKENLHRAQQLKEKLKNMQIPNHKLIVRNIAFQVEKNQIKDLFKQFGTVKRVRLPKKMNGEHRGFGFVEFETVQQAALAKQGLGNTHLYGRRLVIEYENSNK